MQNTIEYIEKHKLTLDDNQALLKKI